MVGQKLESSAVAAYVRVSSAGQSDRSQRTAIRRAAAARGDDVALWFAETVSGRSTVRPELERLREAARAGTVRRVYVFAVDRLTRRGIPEMFRIVEELHRHGCAVVSLADGLDFDGPTGELTLAVFAWCAKYEANRLRDRLQAARTRIEAAGKRWGRPRRMSEQLAKKAAVLKSKGKSIREIAMALKVPRATVGDALRPPSGKPSRPEVDRQPKKPGLKKTDPGPSD